jgi:hypothetical protein
MSYRSFIFRTTVSIQYYHSSFLFYFHWCRSQRWPIIVNESSYEQIIGTKNKPFHYDLFGMKFEPNLQSYGISNLTAYEATYAEILKLCNLDPTSTVFLQYFSDIGSFFCF